MPWGKLAAERGLVVEIAVYGGSRLILASDIRGTSSDVDAVFLREGRTVRQLADDVARRLGLPLDWINEAVTRTAPPIGSEPARTNEHLRLQGSKVGPLKGRRYKAWISAPIPQLKCGLHRQHAVRGGHGKSVPPRSKSLLVCLLAP